MDNELTENNVKIFHISANEQYNKITEPTIEKTSHMIYNFLCSIYQRNILTSLVKYILLKDIIDMLEKSCLTCEKKGVFYLMLKRLNELVFECVVTSFNGANYDNYLICNNLIIILTKLGEKIKIFKKGSSISSIYILIRKNLGRLTNITNYGYVKQEKRNFRKKEKSFWSLNLFFKDIRNLVAQNMSLDKVGKLFNLKVSKLCFPYNQATSITTLKNIDSLRPKDDNFWKDTFSFKTISLEDRLGAQKIFQEKKFQNLYDYSIYYLKQDCILLHSIVLTLFRTYLQENINLFTRRNYSQSNLAYQQFFIIEPSQQILKNVAPVKISNVFLNYFIKQGVTGGICTSFIHGIMNENCTINEHMKYMDFQNIDKTIWPSFSNFQNDSFNENPSTISTIDIRSLYPSAAVKKLPVSFPMLYSRFISSDLDTVAEKQKCSLLNIQNFCKNTREYGDHDKDVFKLLNKTHRFCSEYYALEYYISKLPKNITVIRFQSNFTALGQLFFSKYPIDGFLSFYYENNETLFLKLIQFQSSFFHGHLESCDRKNNEKDMENFNNTNQVRNEIIKLIQHFQNHFHLNVNIEYVELFECDFLQHKIPIMSKFFHRYNNCYSYNNFLQGIIDKKLTGILVVKNLEIKKTSQNPIFGFIIQKVQYNLKNLSPYTQQLIQHLSDVPKVIAINKSKSFMVISTEYFLWLYKTFDFETQPDIYHALLFPLDHYLTKSISDKLTIRKNLKNLLKNESDLEKRQLYEVRAELIKLMLNSCYGFTLCNVNSSKFKSFENKHYFKQHSNRFKNKYKSCLQLNKNVYLCELDKEIQEPFQTLLGHVGCYILFFSKIILLKRLYFLLKYLAPTKSHLLYMDTDSAHFALKHKEFIDNVDPNFKQSFQRLIKKHFENGPKLSGIWVQENYFDIGEYIGEKSYLLYNKNKENYVTHMKGLNAQFQTSVLRDNIDVKQKPVVNFNIFYKSSDFLIYKTYMSKNLFSNYIPIKRYFVHSLGSLPLKFD